MIFHLILFTFIPQTSVFARFFSFSHVTIGIILGKERIPKADLSGSEEPRVIGADKSQIF